MIAHPAGRADVAVVGSGPAGLAMATACAERGLRTVLVAPDPARVWPNTYGAWADELSDDVPVRHRWERVLVVAGRAHDVGRPYVLLDNAALHADLVRRFTARGGTPIAATARCITPAEVALSDGTTIRAGVVVDASGADAAAIRRQSRRDRRPAALQSAYGLVAVVEGMPHPGGATLMDWTGPDRRDPTFLYALDLGDGRWLVEETSLAHRPGLADDELASRLDARLAAMGARVVRTEAVERVRFRMDVPMPVVPQPVLATGAGAALIHPATGYSVAASLRAAPVLADAIAGGGGAGAAWRALWPRDRIRARRLEAFGLERVLTMDQATLRCFFDVFFSLPPDDVAAYLGGAAAPERVAAVMWRMFAAAPFPLRVALSVGDLRSLLARR